MENAAGIGTVTSEMVEGVTEAEHDQMRQASRADEP